MKLEVSAILFFVLNAVESKKTKMIDCDRKFLEYDFSSPEHCVNF